MRILIDTNVVISGTFWAGKPKALLNAVRQGDVTYITSETLLGVFAGIRIVNVSDFLQLYL